MKAKFSSFEQNLMFLFNLGTSFHLIGIPYTWKTMSSFLVPLSCSKLKIWNIKCVQNGIFLANMSKFFIFWTKSSHSPILGANFKFYGFPKAWKSAPSFLRGFHGLNQNFQVLNVLEMPFSMQWRGPTRFLSEIYQNFPP